MTNVLEELKRLMDRRDATEREVRAAIDDKDTFANRRYLTATTERIVAEKELVAAMHTHLPALLAVAQAATLLANSSYTDRDAALALNKALASLTTHPPELNP